MPGIRDIINEFHRHKDVLESQWVLPWLPGVSRPTVWEHAFVRHVMDIPDDDFSDAAEALLDDPSFAARGIALHALATRHLHRFSDRLSDLLCDASMHVRAMAAAAIGPLADHDCIDALLDTKDSEHAEVKKAIIDALRRVADPRSIPLLARWVGRAGGDDELRCKACEALGVIGDDAAMPVLQRVLDDETVGDEVRGAAARAIGRIGVEEGRALLRTALKSPRPWIRAYAIQGLAESRDHANVELMLKHVAPDEKWVVRIECMNGLARQIGQEALRHLLPLVADAERRVRKHLAVVLADLGGAVPRRALIALLDDQDEEVRAQALGAYSRLSGEDFGFAPPSVAHPLDPGCLARALELARAFERSKVEAHAPTLGERDSVDRD